MLSAHFFDNRQVRDSQLVFVQDTREGAATHDVVPFEIPTTTLRQWSLADLYKHVTDNSAPTRLSLHLANADLLSKTLEGWDHRDLVVQAEPLDDEPEADEAYEESDDGFAAASAAPAAGARAIAPMIPEFTMDLTKMLPEGDLYMRLLPMNGAGDSQSEFQNYPWHSYEFIPLTPVSGDDWWSSDEDGGCDDEKTDEEEIEDLEVAHTSVDNTSMDADALISTVSSALFSFCP